MEKEKDVVVDSAPESSKPYSNFEDEWNKLMKTNKNKSNQIYKVEERKIIMKQSLFGRVRDAILADFHNVLDEKERKPNCYVKPIFTR